MRFPHKIDTDVELHLLEISHTRALYALIDRDRSYLRQWQNWPDSLRSIGDMRGLIERLLDKRADGDGIDLVIYYRGLPVGKIGLVFIDWHHRRTEIGYWLAQAYQGRGLVTKSCRVLLDYAFTDLELDSVAIRCAAENIRSRAIPERLGFTYEGFLPHKTWLHGSQIDEVLFRITPESWYDRT